MPFHLQAKRNSLLHMRTSPSPPTSASSFDAGAAGAYGDATEKVSVKDEWGVAELPPLPNFRVGLEDWDSMLSMPNQDQAPMKLISGGDMVSGNNLFNSIDFSGNGVGSLGIVNQGPGFDTNLAALSSFEFDNGGLQSPGFCSQASSVSNEGFGMLEVKPLNLNPGMFPQNPNFLVPLVFPQENHPLQPQLKHHNVNGVEPGAFSIPGQEFSLRKQQQQEPQAGLPQALQFLQQSPQKPIVVKKEEEEVDTQQLYHRQQQHVLLDQLYKVAELVETENFSHAQGILARLNQQLSPIGKPLQRAAFYFKEALQLLLFMSGNSIIALPPLNPSPLDIVSKLDAYKAYSEISPLVQFVNFTCNQVLLEAIGDADRIHVIDFDINVGAHWASFMQELPQSRGARTLKITAFASPLTHHPVELALMRESLTQFANDLGIMFDLDVINIDSLDDNCFSLPISRQYLNEAIAVNFPIWSSSRQPNALPLLLCIVKQLSPKVVVSIDGECNRFDRPFPQHILHALQSYIHLLESVEAVNGCTDTVNKIERFVLQPRIESIVLGYLRVPNRMPNWKTIFASTGFSPVHFSNFTETQAECIVKRIQVKGFQVEKQQASLVLRWQQHELICASAWRC